jgi:hypothetical protein
MVGHLSLKMTKSYTLHKTEQSKQDPIRRFSLDFIMPDSQMETKKEFNKPIISRRIPALLD